MIEYIDIINAIKKCEGSLVTFMFDSYKCNYDFLKILINELKSEYKIEYDCYDINTEVKTVVIIDTSKIPNNGQIRSRVIGSFFKDIIGNNNVILIALKRINLSINPNLYGNEESYLSSLIFALKDKKLTVQKSRYTEIKHTNYLDISNIKQNMRKVKLKQIIKNN